MSANQFQLLEVMIRKGQFHEAERCLRAIPSRKLSREQALQFANIARRIQNYQLALLALTPAVRNPDPRVKGTSEEKIEYAESLRRLGAIDEARTIVSSIDPREYPDALLISAFCLFSQWEYDKAIPLLQACLNHPKLPEYRRLVAKLNLAAALIQTEDLEQAELILNAILKVTTLEGHLLLQGNALELFAQLAIARRQWNEALDFLDHAAKSLATTRSTDALFVQKWRAIAKSLKAGRVSPELEHVRVQAIEEKHWETVRDCDYHKALINKDLKLIEYIFFGTPFESYRNKLVAKTEFSPRTKFVWTGSHEISKTDAILKLESGEIGEFQISPGRSVHRLLMLLCLDFYRPLSLPSAFGQIFPDEHFNPLTSSNRIHQLVKKLREFFYHTRTDIRVAEDGGNYRLLFSGSTGIALEQRRKLHSTQDIEIGNLTRTFNHQEFSAKEAAQALSISLASSKRLLKWAQENGRASRFGKGPASRYKIAS